AAESDHQLTLETIMREGVRHEPDVGVLAARDDDKFAVLVWHYHDDDLTGPEAEVQLEIAGRQWGEAVVTHYRIDENHSNAFTAWQRMASPQQPNQAQYAELEAKMKLAQLDSPGEIGHVGDSLQVKFSLPRAGVSLLIVE